MNPKELIINTLKRMNFSPEFDEDGDIKIHYQLKTIYIMNSDDEPFVSMIFPQFYQIEPEMDGLTLAICNKMTREMKLVKVFVDQSFENVSAACEFFYVNEESLENNIHKALTMLGVVRTIFKKYMDDFSD